MKRPRQMRKESSRKISRRKFLNLSAAAASSLMILPRHVLGGKKYAAPSDKLNIAGIGVGGQGGGDLSRMKDENIVALCDVDWERAARTFKRFPDAPRYRDFRVMLEKQKDIDWFMEEYVKFIQKIKEWEG